MKNTSSTFPSPGSLNKAAYRITNMDCPTEEILIRKKLEGMPGITGLKFNLLQRVLIVTHTLDSTKSIEDALVAIAMNPEPADSVQTVETLYSITGMDCPTEETLIKTRLSGLSGVHDLQFNLVQRTLRVRHEPSALPAITEALLSLNMGAQRMDTKSRTDTLVAENKIPWQKLVWAGLFALASETIDLVQQWQATPFGIDWHNWKIGDITIITWFPLALALVAILLSGLTTYKKGWIAIKNLNLNINALMSVAVTGAVIIGQYPEAAMVMVLFNLAEAIEAKSLDHARNAIKNLLSLTPERATVQQQDGTWKEVTIEQVETGSRVRVRPGERVALDGVIVQGQSTINQAPITGESLPVEKTSGDPVYAGTINESGSFEFRTTAAFTNSTLARIIHAVEEAQGSRAPTQRFVDSFARIYTPAVFFIALLVAIIPPLFMGGTWTSSIYMALVLLVIGCPCALVISTPVTIVSGMAAATRHGILIKGGVFLEQGRLLKWLALDKTGTITHGKPWQSDFVNLVGQSESSHIRSLAASIASRSDHPVSKAIAQDAGENGIPLQEVADFAAIPGQGISGIMEGKKWYLGSHRMVENLQLCSPGLEKHIGALEQQGKSVIALMDEQRVHALFAVADTVKGSSIAAIRELRSLGIKTVMLTGDNEHTARTIAEQVRVDEFQANLLPEDKLHIVGQLRDRGKAGMVGDGINDAPALAKADIGFAMGTAGTDTAIETADVALMNDDLKKIPRFISLSKSTHAILAQNITLALGIKTVFFILTFMGQATMWMAVLADVGASLLVLLNSLRILRK